MHMNSAPHLLNEDRDDFALLLDQALRTTAHRPDLATDADPPLSTEQLRTMALGAASAIAACADAEYQHYTRLRARMRRPDRVTPGSGTATTGETDEGAEGGPVPGAVTDDYGGAGAGLAAVITVLAPVLAGIAAVLFLLIGYVLRAVAPDHAGARPLIGVGWTFAALAATGALIAMGGLLVTAVRNGAPTPESRRAAALAEDLDRARDAWHQALLEQGLLPFLREALTARAADPGTASCAPLTAAEPEGRELSGSRHVTESRIPSLGYSRPRFSSPNTAQSPRLPHYSGPDAGSGEREEPSAGSD